MVRAGGIFGVILVLCAWMAMAQPKVEWTREISADSGQYVWGLWPHGDADYLLVTVSRDANRSPAQDFTVCLADSQFHIRSRHTYSLPGRLLEPLLLKDGRIAFPTNRFAVLMLSAKADSLWESAAIEAHDPGYCCAALTTDNAVIIGGRGVQKGLRLLKVSSDGKQEWVREFGMAPDAAPILGLVSSADGGVFAYGSFGPPSNECAIMHVSAAGDSLQSIYPPPETSCGDIDVLWRTADGGFLIGSRGNAAAGYSRAVRLGADGAKQWQREYPPNADYQQNFWTANLLRDHVVLAGDSGTTDSTGRGLRMEEIDQNGKVLWHSFFPVPHLSVPTEVLATSDGGFLVAATSFGLKNPTGGWPDLIIKCTSGNSRQASQGR